MKKTTRTDRRAVNISQNELWVYAVLLLIFLFFIFTRLYRFGQVPYGLHIDEIGASYDAQCIAHYGVDRYLVRFPVYFKNFGAGQNALYTYLASLLFLFVPFSPKHFRIIAVACGALAFISVFIISCRTFEEKKYALTAPFLLSVMPVFIMSERWGLESYLFVSFAAMMLCLITLAVLGKSDLWWVFAGLITGITLYSYGVSYVVIPLFLIFLYIYLLWIKRVRLKETLLFGIPFILLAVPLFLEQLVTAEILPEFSLGLTDFRRMEYFRADEYGLKYIPKNITKVWLFFSKDHLPYNGSARFGTVLYISVPFIILGLLICLYHALHSIIRKKFDFSVMLLIFFMISFTSSLAIFQMNINRINEVYIAFLFFAAYGIVFFWKRFKFTPVIILALYAIFFIPFWNYYIGGEYNADIAADESGVLFYDTSLGEAVKTLSDFYNEEKQVNISSGEAVERHILIADYCGTSPYEFDSNSSTAGNYVIGLEGDPDLSGNTVYVINKDLHHITNYLAANGFTVDDDSFENYSLVLAP